MKYTNKMKIDGEMAARSLSDKAMEVYEGTDPLNIYEYEADGEKRYACTGCLGDMEGMTFQELQETLEEIADEMNEYND